MTADRRQITLMSCDMVDSTLYASSLDPEDLEELMTSYLNTCKKVIEDNRGTLAHHTGDGFLGYFGFPKTLGRNAQEAIECGLALIEELKKIRLPTGERIGVRVGVATGLVVLNDIHRLNNSSETFAVGGAIHLAARVQSLAERGKIFVDDTTYQLATANFEFADKGEHELKGFAHQHRLWEVLKPKQLGSRFSERIETSAPFVGRSQELQQLTRAWQQAQLGNGQAILISGEPGIGKSRIVHEFNERVAPMLPPLIYQCLEDRENSPLHPWINYMRNLAQLPSRDPLDERKQRATRVFEEALPGQERLQTFVLSMMLQDYQADFADDEIDPAYKLELLREALVSRVQKLGADDVQILLVEDIHWIDPSSEAVWNALVEEAAQHKLLLLATCHADKSDRFQRPGVSNLRLAKLDTKQAIALTSQILDAAQLSGTVVADIVERSDGVPLFVEELARNVSESGFTPDTASSTKASPDVIPNTLQGTLLARLDRLGTAKGLAQLASVIGRSFDTEVLALLCGEPVEELQDRLKALVESGLIRMITSATSRSYEFRHGLIRETANNSLLRRRSVELHARLAEIYEANFPHIRANEPETLAQHLTIAGRWLDAAVVWLEAGTAAKNMGSAEEALVRLDSCLRCLDSADVADGVTPVRIRCELARGDAINTHFGPVEQSAHVAFDEAANLAEKTGDQDAAIDALISLSYLKYNAGDFAGAERVANRLIEYGAKNNNARAPAIGRVAAGMCRFAMGQLQSARELLGKGLELLSSEELTNVRSTGHALSYLALVDFLLGDAQSAREMAGRSIEWARQRNVSDLAAALGNSIYFYVLSGDVASTRQVCNELQPLSEKVGYWMWYHHAQFFLGWADTLGGVTTGFEVMETSMARFRRAQELVEQSCLYCLLAERYLAAGDIENATKNVNLGLGLVEQIGERFFEVPLLRLKARCLEALEDESSEPEITATRTRADQAAEEQGAANWYAGTYQ